MKIANLVLSILILILALVCTVFSFFLFEKRTSLVEGWEKMAAGIAGASSSMTQSGGTVSQNDLAHKDYTGSNMDAKMRAFGTQSKTITRQRDEFAQNLSAIGKSVGMKDDDIKTEQLIEDCGASEDEVKGARAVAKAVARVVNERNREKRRANDYSEKMSEVGGIVGASNRRDTENVVNSVRRTKRNLDNARDDLNRANRELRQTQSDKSRIERERDSYKDRLYAANREKDALQKELSKVKRDYRELTKTEYGDIALWQPGSDEARSKVVGKVVEVNEKNGYIIMDLNNTIRIPQQVGAKVLKVDPLLQRGLEMIVCRGQLGESGKLQFIARIKIHSIDEKCSIANIPADAAKAIKVGDIVINNSFFEKNLKNDGK